MRKLFIASIAAVALAACGGDSTAPPASIAGTYVLQTVNSAPLPFTVIATTDYKFEILSDSYQIRDDGTYSGTSQFRETLNGTATVETDNSTGTYTRAGSSITLTDSVDPTDKFTGTVDGGTFTVTAEGFVLVYKKS